MNALDSAVFVLVLLLISVVGIAFSRRGASASQQDALIGSK